MNGQWTKGASPRDGRRYQIRLKNFLGETWEDEAQADPHAHGGWRNGKWQDIASEVKTFRPIANDSDSEATLRPCGAVNDCDIRGATRSLSS